MTYDWAQWQGQVVDGQFRLERYLGGTEHGGVFATESKGQKAVIKVRAGEARNEPGSDLSHPHLLRILRTGRAELDGTPLSYVVMEFADEVLSNFVPGRSLSQEEASETLAPVLDALGYLHGRGLVHGRIKPSNILSAGEKLKISSDGLRRSGEASRLTGMRGSYDAPEITEGRITPATDVWSVGVTLVEMLTQQLPVWDGAGDAVLPAKLPEMFRDIASHCLEQDPQKRWTVSQLSARLSGKEPAAAPAIERAAEPLGGPVKRKTTALVAGAVAVVVVAGALFLRSRPMAEAPNAPPPATARQEAAPVAQPASPEEKPAAEPAKRVRAKVKQEARPAVSPKALSTIQGSVKVRVRVRVDSSGKVVQTKLDTPRVSRYFATAALQAARRWKFAPATEGGSALASSWVLEFDFGRGGTQMRARQVS